MTLLRHRGVAATRTGDEGAEPGRDLLRIVTAPLARGVVAQCEGYVLVTEEEIFGARAKRKAEPKKGQTKAFLEDLRTLDPAIWSCTWITALVATWASNASLMAAGVGVDLLIVEYGGGDKLFLPVHRLSQIQKYSGGEAHPSSIGSADRRSRRPKAKVERHVRQMADDLLRLAAERSAVQKDALEAPGDDYQAFEAAFRSKRRATKPARSPKCFPIFKIPKSWIDWCAATSASVRPKSH